MFLCVYLHAIMFVGEANCVYLSWKTKLMRYLRSLQTPSIHTHVQSKQPPATNSSNNMSQHKCHAYMHTHTPHTRTKHSMLPCTWNVYIYTWLFCHVGAAAQAHEPGPDGAGQNTTNMEICIGDIFMCVLCLCVYLRTIMSFRRCCNKHMNVVARWWSRSRYNKYGDRHG
jgi:hypothetical protein